MGAESRSPWLWGELSGDVLAKRTQGGQVAPVTLAKRTRAGAAQAAIVSWGDVSRRP
jgi:hypothetical protein